MNLKVQGGNQPGVQQGQPGPRPDALERDANNFGKIAPKFRLGEQTWEVFHLSFKIQASRFANLDDRMYKIILFSCLQGEALYLFISITSKPD